MRIVLQCWTNLDHYTNGVLIILASPAQCQRFNFTAIQLASPNTKRSVSMPLATVANPAQSFLIDKTVS